MSGTLEVKLLLFRIVMVTTIKFNYQTFFYACKVNNIVKDYMLAAEMQS